MDSRRALTEARMGLSRLERLSEVQLGVLEQSRDRLSSLARAGDALGFQREKRKAERTLRELHGSLEQVLSLRSGLCGAGEEAQFDAEFRPLSARIERLLPLVSAAIALSPPTPAPNSPTLTHQLSARDDQDEGEGLTQRSLQQQDLRLIRDRVLADQQETLRLERDIQDIHTIMTDLSSMVHEQQEMVDSIESHVENAQHNVAAGGRQLKKAERYKTQSYPLAGAAVGAAVAGGPVGFAAGSIIAAVAAGVTGGVLGAIGGKFWKKSQREGED